MTKTYMVFGQLVFYLVMIVGCLRTIQYLVALLATLWKQFR